MQNEFIQHVRWMNSYNLRKANFINLNHSFVSYTGMMWKHWPLTKWRIIVSKVLVTFLIHPNPFSYCWMNIWWHITRWYIISKYCEIAQKRHRKTHIYKRMSTIPSDVNSWLNDSGETPFYINFAKRIE